MSSVTSDGLSAADPTAIDASQHLSSVHTAEDLFRLLERGGPDTGTKLKQSIEELVFDGTVQNSHIMLISLSLSVSVAVKDSWLVLGLYEGYCQRESSPPLLDLLLKCVETEPHEKHLLDRIAEGIRQGGKAR